MKNMRMIAYKRLKLFYLSHPDAKEPLDDWYDKVRKAQFSSFSEIKKAFPSADIVGKVIVFNIKGNRYRLISAFHFDTQIVYILEVMTHAEYSKEIWKRRYQIYS